MDQERFFVTVQASPLEIVAIVIGALTALLFFGVLVWTIKTAIEARRANDLTSTEMDIRLRASIGIQIPIYPDNFPAGADRVARFTLPVKNHGATPANEIDIHVNAGRS